MLAWQTSSLVFHGALGLLHSLTISHSIQYLCLERVGKWNKAQLACHDITNCMSHIQASRSTWMLRCVIVSCLFYLYLSKKHGVAEVAAAKMAYRSIDTAISQYAISISMVKRSVSAKIAHPSVSQKYLDEFIDNLDANSSYLLPLQVRLFAFLRAASLSAATSNWSSVLQD